MYTKKSGETGMTMADIVIYHEIQTALMFTNSQGLDPSVFPSTVIWLSKMSSHAVMIEQDRKLNDFINYAPGSPTPQKGKFNW